MESHYIWRNLVIFHFDSQFFFNCRYVIWWLWFYIIQLWNFPCGLWHYLCSATWKHWEPHLRFIFPTLTYYLCWYLPNNKGASGLQWLQLQWLQLTPTSQSWRKSVLNIHWKDWCWSWNSSTLTTWCEELTVGKDSDTGKDWRQEEKGMIEYEMVGWHHGLNGHEFEQTLGVGEGQGSLVCCSPWGCRESDMTERLNWTELSG